MAAIKRTTVTEQASEEIRKYLLSGELKTGDKLATETELSVMLGVGRSTVREAIRILQAMGYVELRPGKGAFAAVTTEEDANAAYTAQVISPIIADGEAIGAVLLLSREQGARMGDTELKVAETAAGIVGRQMEQ